MDRFHFILYLLVLPLLLYNSIQQENLLLFSCFLIILLFHLYRDWKGEKWKIPKWTEPFGFIIGLIIFLISNNILVKLVGLLKVIAHIRQFAFNDNVYYFN